MELKGKVVGTKVFDDSPMTITDPCYDAGTWCALYNIRVKPGEYRCVAWHGEDSYKIDGIKYRDKRVFMSGIYSNEYYEDTRKKKSRIGSIGVDAGLAGYYQGKPDYDDEAWSDFCDKIRNRDYLMTDEGFCTSTGYGDGTYPVYAYKNADGEIVAIEISYC